MQLLAGIFSLLVGAAGWFYLFYSRAVENLAAVEDLGTNQYRARLRRLGGIAMILLAIAFYICCVMLSRGNLRAFAGTLFAVLALMGVILVLGLIDLRLTNKLRRQARHNEKQPPEQ